MTGQIQSLIWHPLKKLANSLRTGKHLNVGTNTRRVQHQNSSRTVGVSKLISIRVFGDYAEQTTHQVVNLLSKNMAVFSSVETKHYSGAFGPLQGKSLTVLFNERNEPITRIHGFKPNAIKALVKTQRELKV